MYMWFRLANVPVETCFLAERPLSMYQKLFRGVRSPLREDIHMFPHAEAYIFNDYGGKATIYYRHVADPAGFFSRWDSTTHDRDGAWQCSALDLRYHSKAYHAEWAQPIVLRARL